MLEAYLGGCAAVDFSGSRVLFERGEMSSRGNSITMTTIMDFRNSADSIDSCKSANESPNVENECH
jgi:hypothetical protein